MRPDRVQYQLRFAFGVALACAACRNSSETPASALVVVPNQSGANGCSGPDQVFAPPQTPTVVALATLVVGPRSQITAAAGGELLYATGGDASVVAIDVSGAAAVETVLVPGGAGPGTVSERLLALGISATPELSGVAVLDADRLVVVEHAANVLLEIQRAPPFGVALYAGLPSTVPGFADGPALGTSGVARFSFSAATQLCPTGDVPPRVFVADPGNHRVRMVHEVDAGGGVFVRAVASIAGLGTPGFADGDLSGAAFDTPTGLSAACNGTLVVSEQGSLAGLGNRIRQVQIGAPSFFGGFSGAVLTLVGDGTDATQGSSSGTALVSQPLSPLVTGDGETYWVDSGSGVLRRLALDLTVDCPLAADCASAVLAPSFPAGDALCLTETAGGVLYVLDATAGVLYRVTP